MKSSLLYAEKKLTDELRILERQLEESLNKMEMYEDLKHNEGLNYNNIQERIKDMKLAIAKLTGGE